MLHHNNKNAELDQHILILSCRIFQAHKISAISPFQWKQAKPFNTYVIMQGFWYKSLL